eukprot:3439948-Lingulodinium_polyedra.AAC.1
MCSVSRVSPLQSRSSPLQLQSIVASVQVIVEPLAVDCFYSGWWRRSFVERAQCRVSPCGVSC